MPTSRLPACRLIPHTLPSRCRNPSSRSPTPRQFSHNSQLLLVVSPASPRPQLPFLYPSSHRLHPRVRNGQWQLNRLLTTERKKYIKDTAKLSVKFSIIFFAISSLGTIASLAILSEQQERAFPSPPEWSLITKYYFRNGRWEEVPENNQSGVPDWVKTYFQFMGALDRLEDTSKDGAGLKEQEEGGILVPGVGKAGFDITGKSEEWRQGYYEVLIGMGRAAEHIDGWVVEKTTKRGHKLAWPPEHIKTASNPKPRPPPPRAPDPPLEENCELISRPPETYYLKILTTPGFTSHQRLTAALSYADWLAFKGLNESAEEMYQWGLDIACAGLPDATNIINGKTGVILASAPSVTPNVVLAATTMATHYATTGNVATALPIFLSVLRARRAAPPAPIAPPPPKVESSIWNSIRQFVETPPYPALPPTGDEPLLRSPSDVCEEATLMNFISEILFASASSDAQRSAGLSWAREAVQTAKSYTASEPTDQKARRKCMECEEAGLDNWSKMMGRLVKDAKAKAEDSPSWKGWIGLGRNSEVVEKLESEEKDVLQRLEKVSDLIMKESTTKITDTSRSETV
ncbi:hypothetical protein BU16DRAFT_576909 [Lophium mytilinum]|uniref:MFS maltose permease n=1 Tax=Lophium mytilinum TaxID=390894 RepID=A0A6A6RGY7_9PEZI|nr:hypothetical protein BU16DRAFT_576909 [Lophium mytilinum]